jgi:hypothetical protein
MSSDGHEAPIAEYVDTAEWAAVDERHAGNQQSLFFLAERMANVRKDILS